MSAFDVTASPPKLSLEAGTSATIVVTVTNRLGRGAVGRVDPVTQPTGMESWFKAPPDVQRPFNSQPTTEDFRFELAVPADKAGTNLTVTFVATEVGLADDNFGQSNVVGVTVSPKAVIIDDKKDPGTKIPWWVWALAALVVIGAGIAIMMMTGGKKMPNLVEKRFEDANETLQKRGVVVQIRDTIHSDTTTYKARMVISQAPPPDTKLKGTEAAPDTAFLLVQRDFVVVPDVSHQSTDAGGNALGQAGLFVAVSPRNIPDSAQAEKRLILDTDPKAGTLVERGDTVRAFVGVWCRPGSACDKKWYLIYDKLKLDAAKANNTAISKIVFPKVP
jgi:hypothetical protein